MIKNTKLSKRNMDVSIGSVKANIDLYNILVHSERPYERHEHNVIINNHDENIDPILCNVLNICIKEKLNSFIIINSIKLENNDLGYESYSKKDIERVLDAMYNMADISLILLGYSNTQTVEIDEFYNINFIYENIVPTYEKYNFVDVSATTARSEDIVVMGNGPEIGRLL